MEEEKELVWLPRLLANKIKEVKDPASEEMLTLINGYIDKTRKSYKENLEELNEDVLVFRGLLVSVKKQYKDALDTALNSDYELWEAIDAQKPKLKEKLKSLTDEFGPLVLVLKEITDLLKTINTWEIKQLVEQVSFLSSHLNGETGNLIRFICTEYKPKHKKDKPDKP